MKDDLIPLDTICEQYFGLSPKGARQKAVHGLLPIPAFRLTAGRRGPMFVNKGDLEQLIESRRSQAAVAVA